MTQESHYSGSSGLKAMLLLFILLVGVLLSSQTIQVHAMWGSDDSDTNLAHPQDQAVNATKHPGMHYTPSTLHKALDFERTGQRAAIRPSIMMMAAPEHFDLLQYLQYTPEERDQGYAGNCWVWAGTGVMEVALDVQKSIKDRLSVQYFDSNYYYNYPAPTGGWAGCGGDLNSFAQFYSPGETSQAVSWSNSNAAYGDYYQSCSEGTAVHAYNILTSANYQLSSISAVVVPNTHGQSQALIIDSIKNVLQQNRAIWFAFTLPNGNAWNDFGSFWWNQPESASYDMSKFNGQSYNYDTGAGHAVLLVGYDDTNPNDKYWIAVNSWGTAPARPNGIFHFKMNMNYDTEIFDPDPQYGGWFYNLWWETLDLDYGLGTELAYDDGEVGGSSAVGPGEYMAVRFSLPSGLAAATVSRVSYYIFDVAPFNVHIFESDGVTDLCTLQADPPSGFEGWLRVDLASCGISVSGDFYAAIEYTTDQEFKPRVGQDPHDPDGRSYIGVDGEWWLFGGDPPAPPDPVDLMIRTEITATAHTVTFLTTTGTGSVTADDIEKSHRESGIYLPDARVRVVANAPDGYPFDHWEVSGVSVDDAYSADTYMTVSGNGWLKVHFTFPYPSCGAAFSLTGTRINVYGGGVQTLLASDYSWLRHGWGIYPWSMMSESDRQEFLSSGTNFALSIDTSPWPLSETLCYDEDGSWVGYAGGENAVWKQYWVQFTPYQWAGAHTFDGEWFWNGALSLSRTLTAQFLVSSYAAKIIDPVAVVPDQSEIGQGSKVVFTVTVQNTGAKDISSAKVQVKIYKPDGSLAGSPYKSISKFKVGTERTAEITYTLPSSAPAGDWTYAVDVYRGSTLLTQATDPDQVFTVQEIVAGELVLSAGVSYTVNKDQGLADSDNFVVPLTLKNDRVTLTGPDGANIAIHDGGGNDNYAVNSSGAITLEYDGGIGPGNDKVKFTVLQAGDDRITINDGEGNDQYTFTLTGPGTDTLTFNDANAAGNDKYYITFTANQPGPSLAVTANDAYGNDAYTIKANKVLLGDTTATLNDAAGNDKYMLDLTGSGSSSDTFTFNDGDGNDKYDVTFTANQPGPNVLTYAVDDAAGNDAYSLKASKVTVGDVSVQFNDAAGNDKLTISDLAATGGVDVKIDDGGGNDVYSVKNIASTTTTTIEIQDAAGNDGYTYTQGKQESADTVTVTDSDGTNKYSIDTGPGNDGVTINDGSGLSTYNIKLGDGDDWLSVTDSASKDSYKLDGGKGVDTLTKTDNFPDDKDTWPTSANLSKTFETIVE
jgi:uncharacterized protein YxjI